MPLPPTDPYRRYQTPKRRTGLIVGIVIGALVVLIGAGAGGFALAQHGRSAGTKAAPATDRPTPTPSATATDAARDHSGDLRQFLLDPPATSRPWSDPPSVDGNLSLTDITSYYDNPKSEETYLKGLGFRAGAVQTWLEADGSTVEIDLYRFQSSNGAYSYFQDLVSSDVTSPPTGTGITLVAKVPTGHGEVVSFAKKDKYGQQMSHGLGVRDDVAFEIWVYQHAPQSVAVTESLVYRQWLNL